MKKFIFALILIVVTSQSGVMIGQVENLTPTRISQLRGLPGVSIMAFLIHNPGLTAHEAIQNLQPPQVTDDERINTSLKNIHDAYVSLVTQNLDKDTLAKAKQEIESLKLAGDAIKLPALKNYFLNLASIARKKLHEVWENKETPENLDIILDADFSLEPLVKVISESVPSAPISTQFETAQTAAQQAAAEEQEMQAAQEELIPIGTPVTPPPLPPSQIMPIESRARIGTMISHPLPGHKVIPIKPNIQPTY